MQNDKAVYDDQKRDGLYQHNAVAEFGFKRKCTFFSTSVLVYFLDGHRSPAPYFLVGLAGRPQRSKGKNSRVIECVILTNVYNGEAF